MTGARTALENQIKTKAEAAAKSQTKISGADIAQFNSLIQGVIQQEVVKMKSSVRTVNKPADDIKHIS